MFRNKEFGNTKIQIHSNAPSETFESVESQLSELAEIHMYLLQKLDCRLYEVTINEKNFINGKNEEVFQFDEEISLNEKNNKIISAIHKKEDEIKNWIKTEREWIQFFWEETSSKIDSLKEERLGAITNHKINALSNFIDETTEYFHERHSEIGKVIQEIETISTRLVDTEIDQVRVIGFGWK